MNKKVIIDLNITGRIPSVLSRKGIQKVIKHVAQFLKRDKMIIGLAFLSEGKMEVVNKKYHHSSGPTDVLSFTYSVDRSIIEGDILICPTYTKKLAKQNKSDYYQELQRLLIHGVLHLAGYDHFTDREEKRMFRIQEKLLQEV